MFGCFDTVSLHGWRKEQRRLKLSVGSWWNETSALFALIVSLVKRAPLASVPQQCPSSPHMELIWRKETKKQNKENCQPTELLPSMLASFFIPDKHFAFPKISGDSGNSKCPGRLIFLSVKAVTDNWTKSNQQAIIITLKTEKQRNTETLCHHTKMRNSPFTLLLFPICQKWCDSCWPHVGVILHVMQLPILQPDAWVSEWISVSYHFNGMSLQQLRDSQITDRQTLQPEKMRPG